MYVHTYLYTQLIIIWHTIHCFEKLFGVKEKAETCQRAIHDDEGEIAF